MVERSDARGSRPNVLLITTDQQRWDFYDNRYVESLRTPNIQRLMREGTTFTHGYTNCPICMPTRFTWLHGLYAQQVSAALARNSEDWPAPGRYPTFAQALRETGYRTGLVGKLHSMAGLWHRDISIDERPKTLARGFDDVVEVSGKSLAYWYDCDWTRYLEKTGRLREYRAYLRAHGELGNGYRGGEGVSVLPREDTMDAFIARGACEWLSSHASAGRQWMLHASFCGPHFPLDALPDYLSRYNPDDMPVPEGVDDPERIRGWKIRRAHYCAVIEHLDEEIGTVLNALDASGQAESTLVLFTTDHGDLMGHRNRSNKGLPDDGSTRTPVIARWPGKVAARVTSSAILEAADLPCTILDVAGIDPRTALPGSPGRSYAASLRDPAVAHREWAYSETNKWRMVRDHEWKYVYHLGGEEILIDMRCDPLESNNLLRDPAQAERVSRMRQRMIESMSRCVPPDASYKPIPRHNWFDPFLPEGVKPAEVFWDR